MSLNLILNKDDKFKDDFKLKKESNKIRSIFIPKYFRGTRQQIENFINIDNISKMLDIYQINNFDDLKNLFKITDAELDIDIKNLESKML